MKRVAYLALAAVVALLILAPTAMAQDMVPAGDDDPNLPEPNAVVVGSNEELERMAGRPVPSQNPGEPPEKEGLHKTGGPSVSAIVPAAALLLVCSGVLAYGAHRRVREGGGVR